MKDLILSILMGITLIISSISALERIPKPSKDEEDEEVTIVQIPKNATEIEIFDLGYEIGYKNGKRDSAKRHAIVSLWAIILFGGAATVLASASSLFLVL